MDPTAAVMVSATVQYCDSFGHYFCKQATMRYLFDPINRFQNVGELDCSGSYGAVPNITREMYGTDKPLPPCSTPEEDKKNQEDYLRSYGWKTTP